MPTEHYRCSCSHHRNRSNLTSNKVLGLYAGQPHSRDTWRDREDKTDQTGGSQTQKILDHFIHEGFINSTVGVQRSVPTLRFQYISVVFRNHVLGLQTNKLNPTNLGLRPKTRTDGCFEFLVDTRRLE